jgi:hypothetical protein
MFLPTEIIHTKWYMKIPLLFCKSYTTVDSGYYIKAKRLWGSIYITELGVVRDDPKPNTILQAMKKKGAVK